MLESVAARQSSVELHWRLVCAFSNDRDGQSFCT
jgi:hypothetical protein